MCSPADLLENRYLKLFLASNFSQVHETLLVDAHRDDGVRGADYRPRFVSADGSIAGDSPNHFYQPRTMDTLVFGNEGQVKGDSSC